MTAHVEPVAITTPIARPRLPPAQALLPYLARIDESRRYSNHGPLESELQTRIADRHGLPPNAVAMVANATSGLAAALIGSRARRGATCLVPAWTFSATAHAVRMAGLVPRFVDVDPQTQIPSVETIASAVDRDRTVGAVVIASPFGRPVDPAPWDALARDRALPIVLDAAAGFDGLRPGRLATVVSLHATKVLAAGEGGFVISTDARRIAAIAAAANFGFRDDRRSVGDGLNGKLSEYHAAVGLAALDEWAATRAAFQARLARYRDGLGDRVTWSPGLGHEWVTSTAVIDTPAATAIAATLRSAAIETRRWWGAGCHRQPAFSDCPADRVLETDRIARRNLALPLHPDLPLATIDRITAIVRQVVSR